MNKTYFIADLHLSADRDDITDCFARFLQQDAPHADALYILGDLFEAWIGDDDINPFTAHVAELINGLNQHQVPVYFIHGNRDFLIRKTFAKRAGMKLLPEQTVIDLYGTPTLIMHGDELCTLDVNYQKFRLKARGWWWPRMILSLPLWCRRKIADNGRKKSQQNQSQLARNITDVTTEEVINAMDHAGVTQLIHGHTHRPNIHQVSLKNGAGTRIVMGDWYTQGSVLEVCPEKVELKSHHFAETGKI